MTEISWPWTRAILVGASSGIGQAMARALVARGCTVALAARREERLTAIASDLNSGRERPAARVYVHDVRDTAGVETLFQQMTTDLGGLDLVVYAAGIMPLVQKDEYPTAADIATIEANFSGAVAWLNQAAFRFSRARAGTIVGISSVAGDRGRRGNPVYNATKAALNTYLEALRNRLATRGVTVLTAKPGYVRTELIEDRPIPRFIPVADPDDAAMQILDAAAAGRRVAYVPPWWRWVMQAVRLVPAALFERLNV